MQKLKSAQRVQTSTQGCANDLDLLKKTELPVSSNMTLDLRLYVLSIQR